MQSIDHSPIPTDKVLRLALQAVDLQLATSHNEHIHPFLHRLQLLILMANELWYFH